MILRFLAHWLMARHCCIPPAKRHEEHAIEGCTVAKDGEREMPPAKRVGGNQPELRGDRRPGG